MVRFMTVYAKNNKQLFESSAKTREPLCEYYGECGGCDLQHISYEEQLGVKMQWLRQIFTHFPQTKILEIIPSLQEYFYRNRITLHHNKKQFGFYKANTHDIVPIQKCVIASEVINEKLSHLGSQVLCGDPSFELREDDNSSFLQVNNYQNENMLETVLNYCRGQKTQSILELYCGSGNLTFPLSKISRSILAIDGDEAAITLAEERRRSDKIKKIRFQTSPVYDAVFKLSQDFESFDVIVCDPPREGIKQSSKILPRFKAKKIIYVSCNPVSFIKDAQVLCQKDYELIEVTPIDMFPQTRHVEIVGLFTG